MDQMSPIPNIKPYSLKRSKINFTMDDLENDQDEDEDYEISAIPSTSKSQPKRSCRSKQSLVPNQSDTSEDEATLKNTTDQEDQTNEEKNQFSESEQLPERDDEPSLKKQPMRYARGNQINPNNQVLSKVRSYAF